MATDIIQYILGGAAITLGVTAVALPMGFSLGLLLSLLRVYGRSLISRPVALYSAAMRGIPPIVLLFILYFIIAGSVNISPFWAGSLSLGIISSAYQLEIFRGALQSVESGQLMAARAIGMTQIQALRNVIVPQALRLAIPPWSNEASTVIKDSSLVYAIGVAEILRRAQFMSARTQRPFLAFGTAALFYFLLTFAANRVLDRIEERTRIPSR